MEITWGRRENYIEFWLENLQDWRALENPKVILHTNRVLVIGG
jgi:hypothetical protein